MKNLILLLLVCCAAGPALGQIAGVEHVIVIGVDGMSPDGVRQARTPHLDRMMREGAFTLQARGVLPTVSSPNWASMIMGAGPEQHGVTSNEWQRDEYSIPPSVTGSEPVFPTIFGVLRAQRPAAGIGAVYHWEGFGRLFERSAVNYAIHTPTEEETAATAIAYLRDKRPAFCFIHFDNVDHAGHSKGHGTAAYFQSIEKTDSLIGGILEALEISGMMPNTLVLVTADHGGVGFGHGGQSPEELEIPFILYGKGVKTGYEIPEPVTTIDNAPTVAFALGLDIPYEWTGRPVKGAFAGFPAPRLAYPRFAAVRKPVLSPRKENALIAGGLFIGAIPPVEIRNPNKTGDIRYTLDGSVPTWRSPRYTQPLKLNATTVVNAAIFHDTLMVSQPAIGYFRLLRDKAGHGVVYTCYEGRDMEALPDFSTLPPASAPGLTYEFNLDSVQTPRPEQVAVVFKAYLKIDNPGRYTFYTASDDGSRLLIDGWEVVDNDGNHGVVEQSGSVELTAGFHPIEVHWYNGGGGMGLEVLYKGPGRPKQVLPAEVLYERPK